MARPREGFDAQGIPRRRIVKAVEVLPRRLRDRDRTRLREAGPRLVATFRARSPFRTGSLRKSWRFRTVAHATGGHKIVMRANFYWFYLNNRGRHRGWARRAADAARRHLKDAAITFLPPSRPR